MENAIHITKPVEVRNPSSNVDALYGPYSSRDAANAAIPKSQRKIGRTVVVNGTDGAVEYWYKEGIEDENLVLKIPDNTPKLDYINPPEGSTLTNNFKVQVRFTSPAYGDWTARIYRDGNLIKTLKVSKGDSYITLDRPSEDGTYKYTIIGTDALGNPADKSLEYNAIIGGAKLSTNFQSVIDGTSPLGIINTSTNLSLTYSASVADTSKTVKIYGVILNSNQQSVKEYSYSEAGQSSILSEVWSINSLSTSDNYTLTIYAYTGESPYDEEDQYRTSLTYNFLLLDANDFQLSSTVTSITTNTGSSINIPFRVYSGTNRQLRAHGKLYTEGGVEVSGYELNRAVAVNRQDVWAINRIKVAGNYYFEMWATTEDEQEAPSHVRITIPTEVEEYIPEYDVVSTGLIADFRANGHSNNNDDDKKGYWTNEVENSPYYFQLNDLNYITNGWISAGESEGMMLKMTGDSFGRLKQKSGALPSPSDADFSPISFLDNVQTDGISIEILYRTRNIGELSAKVMTAHYRNETSGTGFSASYDTLTVGHNGEQIKLDASEEEWIHAVMVIDRTVHNDTTLPLQDRTPKKLMTIYINGSACSAKILSDNATFTEYPVILNGALNASNNVDFFGSCEIKAIRFYRKPLYASEVVQNYIASIDNPIRQRETHDKNDISVQQVPIVHFIKNGDASSTWEQLNNVTDKSAQKTVFVYSKVIYQPVDDTPITWNYVKVQTQGTSSLLYPVKNYKITLYDDNTYRHEEPTDVFTSDGVIPLGWRSESVFTLKCDYMEAAHLNNTPSCTFYNDMIDTLIADGTIQDGNWNSDDYDCTEDERSAARRGTYDSQSQTTTTYYDAIKGFPCLVYYYDSQSDYDGGISHYAGSYMFNLDKSANSLGFESPAKLSPNKHIELISNPRYGLVSGAEEYVENVCQSFEVKANASDTAGCFYSFADWQQSWYDRYLDGAFELFKAEYPLYNESTTYNIGAKCSQYKLVSGNNVLWTYVALENNISGEWDVTKWDEVIECSESAFITQYGDGSEAYRQAIPEYNSSSTYNIGDKCTHRDDTVLWVYRANRNNITGEWNPDNWTRINYDDGGYITDKNTYLANTSPYADEYEYYAADFEARYDWDNLKKGGIEFWGDDTWGLKRIINWVSANYPNAGKSGNEDTFKTGFKDYFNLNYCMLYYLQMIVFGQVDNAGKNAMWDTWDGKIWMPRPYDLDTATGLDNTGFEIIAPDAELNPELSPYQLVDTTGYAAYSDNVASTANLRYEAYNTRTSKFWRAFGKSFKTEIQNLYATLRGNGTYTIDNILTKYKALTSDIIAETYYNMDMVSKFYSPDYIETYITRVHGNRIQRFKAWMSQRITFCDSLFDYNSGDSLNKSISFRIQSPENAATRSVTIVIQTYTPQYVAIDVGMGYDATIEAYCSPDARYIDQQGNVLEGTTFTIPITAGNKETAIKGGGNIKLLGNFNALLAYSLDVTNATKLNNLDLSSSTKLTTLTIAYNKGLRYLNCNDATELTGAIDVSHCENLRTITLDNTKVTGVSFAEGGSLKTISLRNTAVTEVNLQSLSFLESVNVDGCRNILSYYINNCPKITSISANELPVTSVVITDCIALEHLFLEFNNDMNVVTIERCPNLTEISFKNSNSQALTEIDLSTLYGLTSLDISGTPIEKVTFPKYADVQSPNLWGNDFTNFGLSGSSIKYVQYGSEVSEGVNLYQLRNLSSLTFNNCSQVEKILNIDYIGPCSSVVGSDWVGMFERCVKLTQITGSIVCQGRALGLFRDCFELRDISELDVDFTDCTSLQHAFRRCPKLTLSSIKTILDRCGDSLTTLVNMCYQKNNNASGQAQTGTAYTVIPANFFGNCKHVTSIATVFYNAGITRIHPDAFIDSNNQTGLPLCTDAHGAFAANGNLTTLVTNILEYLPAVKNVSSLFQNCTTLGSDNTPLPSAFFNSQNSQIENITGIFYRCSNLIIDMSQMGGLFTPLTQLKKASLAFAGCTKCIGTIPNGFFAHNGLLEEVAGCFSRTGVTGLPDSLFRMEGDTTTEFTYLTDICGMFNNTAISSTPGASLFAGASNVLYAGMKTLPVGLGGLSEVLNGMFYNCTNINSFSKDLFKPLVSVQDLSGFFSGCTGIIGQTGGGLDADVLNTLTNLINISQMFKNCSSLAVSIPSELFDGPDSTLRNISELFAGCRISNFSNTIFNNMENLTNAARVFAGCEYLSIDMSNMVLFAGCYNLSNVSEAFADCKNITGSIPAQLFNSCRSTLTNVSGMFSNCTSLDGGIGVGNEDSLRTQLGLLANCTQLTTTSNMFYNCTSLGGAVPWDIFWTNSSDNIYAYLTDISGMFDNCKFDQPCVYQQNSYLFHPDTFTKLRMVQNMSRLFRRAPSAAWHWGGTYSIYSTSFDSQIAVTSIRQMFSRCDGLGGTIPRQLFQNSLYSLYDAYAAFAATSIQAIGSNFLRVNDSVTPNRTLKYVGNMFYGCDDVTSDLPPMNVSSLYSSIDTVVSQGCYGYAYNCTLATNYNTFNNDWTYNTQYSD